MAGLLTDRRQLLFVAASASMLAGDAGRAGAVERPAGGLRVVAEIVAKPEHANEIRDALTSFAGAARSEAGCLHYDLYEDRDHPGRFFTEETWTDEAALEAHLTSPAMKAAGPRLGAMLAAPPEIIRLRPLNVA